MEMSATSKAVGLNKCYLKRGGAEMNAASRVKGVGLNGNERD